MSPPFASALKAACFDRNFPRNAVQRVDAAWNTLIAARYDQNRKSIFAGWSSYLKSFTSKQKAEPAREQLLQRAISFVTSLEEGDRLKLRRHAMNLAKAITTVCGPSEVQHQIEATHILPVQAQRPRKTSRGHAVSAQASVSPTRSMTMQHRRPGSLKNWRKGGMASRDGLRTSEFSAHPPGEITNRLERPRSQTSQTPQRLESMPLAKRPHVAQQLRHPTNMNNRTQKTWKGNSAYQAFEHFDGSPTQYLWDVMRRRRDQAIASGNVTELQVLPFRTA